MSRTDAHTRYEYLPDGRAYETERLRLQELDPYNWYRCFRKDWNREWNKHWSRPNVQGWYARQENRIERHAAKAALRRGDYDAIPFHMTGRHSAAWLAY